MELSVKEYLDSVLNPNTRKSYRIGIHKFCEWFGKSPQEVLEMRKDDLTAKPGENIIDYRNRAARFEKEIGKFHSYLLKKGAKSEKKRYTTNSARNMTLGIRQLFRYYQMPVQIRAGSPVNKTVKTSRSFPLRIEHVRKMFEVANLRERTILSAATDLGLRISDFIAIKKEELPSLDPKPPIAFDVMTDKNEFLAHGFLSEETVELLKVYLPTLKKDNPYLFPSNGKSHLSDERLNKLLQNLAAKAQLDLNGKKFSFHCFRKMFLSTSVDSGIGLVAGKKLCGKAIPKSDDTYLTTVKLREKFIQLKKFLTITPTTQPENHERVELLENAVTKLQEELDQQKLITQTVTKKFSELKRMVTDMAQQLKEAQMGTAQWKKAEKMGFMGIESEENNQSTSNIDE